VGTIRLAQRNSAQARQAFLNILSADPTKDLESPERLPPAVTRFFYKLRDSLCMTRLNQLVEAKQLVASIRTLAIGDVENNSIAKTSFDTDHLAKGLVHVLTEDLMAGTSLKLVERQRLSVLLDELKLSADPSKMNPDSRVALGQLTGAQSYVFAQYMQLDKDHARMDVRWVSTATGEILLARSVEGATKSAKDIFALERKVAVEVLAPAIDKYTGPDGSTGGSRPRLEELLDKKGAVLSSNSHYIDSVVESGRAVQMEAGGDDSRAAEAWSKAAALNPSDRAAKDRSTALAAYLKAAKTP
jgi:curli biogenesis system outer membrane secretion channel CsgG